MWKEVGGWGLLGEVKGGFRGGENGKKGYLDEGEGGRLFVEEVGKVGLEREEMLVGGIEERGYGGVGEKGEGNLNVGMMGGRNEDLEVWVNEKGFGEDVV